VEEQAESIELAYERADEAAEFIRSGNLHLAKATDRSFAFRLHLVLLILVLTGLLLILDHIHP
jgi:hypothetical protein